jgi:hypothetical protein
MRQYLKARMAEEGTPAPTSGEVNFGKLELVLRGCNSNPLITLGRISMRADKPRSRVVLLSLSSTYLNQR